MSEMEMTTEAEVEDFTDELSDEALDPPKGARATLGCTDHASHRSGPVADR